MSASTRSLEGNPSPRSVITRTGLVPLVNANEVLQKALARRNEVQRRQTVLRCEELPWLQIDEETLLHIFDELLQVAWLNKPEGKQLYLHISHPSALAESEGNAGLAVHFCTNLSTTSLWLDESSQRLRILGGVVTGYGGEFSINQLNNSGCGFTLTLPGRLL